MSLSQEQAAFLRDMCRLVEFASSQGFMVTPGELYRTPEQQELGNATPAASAAASTV